MMTENRPAMGKITAPPDPHVRVTLGEARDAWYALNSQGRLNLFQQLSLADAEELFRSMNAAERAEIVLGVPARALFGLLEPDEIADVIQKAEPERREELLGRLDTARRAEVGALLNYAADQAGGLMNPQYNTLHADWNAAAALNYLKKRARNGNQGGFYYNYVVDNEHRLVGVASLRELLAADATTLVATFMDTKVITLAENQDQEEVAKIFQQCRLLALPVLDKEGHIRGIVTIDDAMAVVKDEHTEDTQKMGGVEALGDRYLQVGLGEMIRKRAGWLAILFVGEMLTASAMAHYEAEIAQAVILALFVPLIISSGGNSGSQASTLVVRAMALGEVRLRDWWRVVRRELVLGLSLGLILATIGLSRILIWQALFGSYGEHYLLVAITVALSLVLIVTWGSLSGCILPFLLRLCRFDPASASTPFVATMVDVTGLVIYFTVASFVLRGTLL